MKFDCCTKYIFIAVVRTYDSINMTSSIDTAEFVIRKVGIQDKCNKVLPSKTTFVPTGITTTTRSISFVEENAMIDQNDKTITIYTDNHLSPIKTHKQNTTIHELLPKKTIQVNPTQPYVTNISITRISNNTEEVNNNNNNSPYNAFLLTTTSLSTPTTTSGKSYFSDNHSLSITYGTEIINEDDI